MSCKTLLVIDYTTNWFEVFGRNSTLTSGDKIKVEQSEWKDITVEMSSEDGALVYCKASDNPLPFSNQKEDRIVKPDFMLIRNFPISLRSKDYKSQIMGLMAANIPAVNSLHSLFMCMHRPLIYGELLKVSKEIQAGEYSEKAKAIQVVPLRYNSNTTDVSLQSSKLSKPKEDEKVHSGAYPCVVKVSNTHAGYGKMFLSNEGDYSDLKSILAIRDDYYTTEPKLDFEYEYRIQKIGDHYRCFRRNSDNCWKGNWGNVKFSDHTLEDHHIVWADKCATIYGGLDIFGIDVVHCSDGSEYILEINDSACGLMYEHEEEDISHMKELVLKRMNEVFCSN